MELPGNFEERKLVFVSMPIGNVDCGDWEVTPGSHAVVCGHCDTLAPFDEEPRVCEEKYRILNDRAREAFLKVWADGKLAITLPALLVMQYYDLNYEEWMTAMVNVLARCDEVYRLRGESSGADREVELALRLGLVVTYE